MKPVYQTTFYPQGNCYAACVASILELPISEVPDFYHDAEGNAYRGDNHEKLLRSWLAERRLCLLRVLPMFDGVWVAPVMLPGGEFYFIASGKSPRFPCNHAVVWGAKEDQTFPAHDPHPEGGFLDGEVKSFDLIVRLHTEPTAAVQPQATAERNKETNDAAKD